MLSKTGALRAATHTTGGPNEDTCLCTTDVHWTEQHAHTYNWSDELITGTYKTCNVKLSIATTSVDVMLRVWKSWA